MDDVGEPTNGSICSDASGVVNISTAGVGLRWL